MPSTKRLVVHPPSESVVAAVAATHYAVKVMGRKPVALFGDPFEDRVLLDGNSPPHRLDIRGCLALAGFGRTKTSAAHLDVSYSGTEREKLPLLIDELVRYVGKKSTFVVAGLPAGRAGKSLREELLNAVREELEKHGIELKEEHISWHGQWPNSVVVDPRKRQMHVFYSEADF
jgi:hypothetical protein